MNILKQLFSPRLRVSAVKQLPFRTFDAKKFKDRLAAMPMDDPLWPMLLELLDAHLLIESSAVAAPNLESGEVRRGCGRISMLHDLRSDLEKTWHDVREQPTEQKPQI